MAASLDDSAEGADEFDWNDSFIVDEREEEADESSTVESVDVDPGALFTEDDRTRLEAYRERLQRELASWKNRETRARERKRKAEARIAKCVTMQEERARTETRVAEILDGLLE